MPGNTTPVHPLLGFAAACKLISTDAAVTDRSPRTGTSGLKLLVAAGASQSPASSFGTRLDRITAKVTPTAAGTSVAMNFWLWLYDGTTAWLIDEISVTSAAYTATTPPQTAHFSLFPQVLPVGMSLYVSQSVTIVDATSLATITANGGTL